MSPSKKTKKAAEKSKYPWRENVEALLMAIVVAVTLKYFFLEISRIPSGSMQPTLMGSPELSINDRVMVDKVSYRFRDPKRFEIVVFKHPLERSRNMVKRVVGMPGEELELRGGDVWIRPEGEDWRVLRRPPEVQTAMWRSLDPTGWTPRGSSVRLKPGTTASYVSPNSNSVLDQYLDGYSPETRARLATLRPYRARNRVGDLRVEGSVTAQSDCTEFAVSILEGGRTYRFLIPGPAAGADSVPRIEVGDGEDGESVTELDGFGGTPPGQARAAEPWRLETGDDISFAAENVDDRLALEIDGERILELEVPAAQPGTSSIRLRVEGGDVLLEELAAFRDVHYLPGRDGSTHVQIPDGHYFMLGDNTQDSADGREWQAVTYRWPEGETGAGAARGNDRKWENPARAKGTDSQLTYFFRDEWGERHVFGAQTAREDGPERAPVVPRELIHGRVFSVFWPLAPWRGVWRLGWIR